MINQQLIASGLNDLKSNLFKHNQPQVFARHDVLIKQGIDPYQRIAEAGKILESGGSLFINEKKRQN